MGYLINPYRFGHTLGSVITGGTNIGDMTGNGNLAASFDGTTNQAHTASSTKSSGTAAFIGKTVTPRRVFKLISYGSNSHGYVNTANPSTTLELRGQVGGSAPATSAAAATDGVSLGTFAFTDTANESGNPREVVSTDNETLFDHIWTLITHDGSAAAMYSAEQQFYEAV